MKLAKEINFPYTENSIFTSNGSEHLNYLATALQEFKEVPLHHMFFLGRDLPKGMLLEVAAAYMGRGNYKILDQYRSKKRATDIDRAQKVIERLGAVPTYQQLVDWLRKGVGA